MNLNTQDTTKLGTREKPERRESPPGNQSPEIQHLTSRHTSDRPLDSDEAMTGKLNIECGLDQVGDVMLCADCRKATTLFRERCLSCGHSNVFTVRDVFDGTVDVSELTSSAGVKWIVGVIDQLVAGVLTGPAPGRIAA